MMGFSGEIQDSIQHDVYKQQLDNFGQKIDGFEPTRQSMYTIF